MTTVVLQSYRMENVPGWVRRCLDSVRAWAERHGHAYRFLGDELLGMVPANLRAQAGHRPAVVADVGRLRWARSVLAEAGVDRVVWLDADVLVWDAATLRVPEAVPFAFGREVWVQEGRNGRGLTVHRSVHNAAMVFARDNPALDFLLWTAENILRRLKEPGQGPPQIVGPKLLTALHSLAGFPLWDQVGMLSPLVLADMARGGGPALERFRTESPPLAAANLCASLPSAAHAAVVENVSGELGALLAPGDRDGGRSVPRHRGEA